MILQCLECLPLCVIPFPFPRSSRFGFLLLLVPCWYQVCKRSTDLAEIMDKASVVPNESQKSSYVLRCSWSWPVNYLIRLSLVDLYTFL
jgi:hypothetical protein